MALVLYFAAAAVFFAAGGFFLLLVRLVSLARRQRVTFDGRRS